MGQVHLFIGLLAAVVLLALVARPIHVPEAVILVLGGLGLGALPFAPDVRLDPDVVLLAFLPPILFPAAAELAREDIRPVVRPIAFLAVGLVLATMATVAVAAHLVIGIPWGPAFVLGSVLGATDPVSATAVLRSAGAPPRIATILEGESLINDGTALTVFRIAVGAVGASFALGSALGRFALVALGGAAVGVALGIAAAWVLRRVDAVEIESALAVLLAYGAFALAEQLGVSGILATVSAGFVVGRRLSDVTSPETRLRSGSFWALLRFLAESMLFVLVGLQFATVLADPAEPAGWELAWGTALVAGVVAATRAVWMVVVPPLSGLTRAGRRRIKPLIPPRELGIVALGGMRGAVSVAAALAIPATAGGAPFPERGAVVVLALASVVALLVAPALALPWAVRALGLREPEEQRRRADRARVALARAALERLEGLARDGDIGDDVADRLREGYEARLAAIHRSEGGERRDDDGLPFDERLRRVRRELLAAERRRLREMERERRVTGELVRELEGRLDLEYEQLSG